LYFSHRLPARIDGWQCYEGPGVQPYWTADHAKEDAIGYATARKIRARGDSRTQSRWQGSDDYPLKQESGSYEAWHGIERDFCSSSQRSSGLLPGQLSGRRFRMIPSSTCGSFSSKRI